MKVLDERFQKTTDTELLQIIDGEQTGRLDYLKQVSVFYDGEILTDEQAKKKARELAISRGLIGVDDEKFN